MNLNDAQYNTLIKSLIKGNLPRTLLNGPFSGELVSATGTFSGEFSMDKTVEVEDYETESTVPVKIRINAGLGDFSVYDPWDSSVNHAKTGFYIRSQVLDGNEYLIGDETAPVFYIAPNTVVQMDSVNPNTSILLHSEGSATYEFATKHPEDAVYHYYINSYMRLSGRLQEDSGVGHNYANAVLGARSYNYDSASQQECDLTILSDYSGGSGACCIGVREQSRSGYASSSFVFVPVAPLNGTEYAKFETHNAGINVDTNIIIAKSLFLTYNGDASGVQDKACALKIGNKDGLHLEFDANEIMCKASATTVNNLYINGDGGDVYLASSNLHVKADGGADVTGSLTVSGAIKSTGSFLSANNCTNWDGGVSGGYLNAAGRLCLVSDSSSNYPHVLFVKNKGTHNIVLRGNNTSTSANYTITLPNSTGTVALTSSDLRLKENIKDAEVSGLDLINKIKLHQFDWLEEGMAGSPHWKVGVIADELEELDTNLASGGGCNEDGSLNVKSVESLYLISYLIKAVQELDEKLRG